MKPEQWSTGSLRLNSLQSQRSKDLNTSSNQKLLQTLLTREAKPTNNSSAWPGLEPLNLKKIDSASLSLKKRMTQSKESKPRQKPSFSPLAIKKFTKVELLSNQNQKDEQPNGTTAPKSFRLMPTNYKQTILKDYEDQNHPKTSRTTDYDSAINRIATGQITNTTMFATARDSTRKTSIFNTKNYGSKTSLKSNKKVEEFYPQTQSRRLPEQKKFRIEYETFNYIDKVIDLKDLWKGYVKKV